MTDEQQKAQDLMTEFVAIGLTPQLAIIASLKVAKHVIDNNPTYEYWSTHYDEQESAVTYWENVSNNLNQILEFINK